MSISFVADGHIGNSRLLAGERVAGLNSRCVERLDCLRAASLLSQECKCDRMFVAGDLFDGVRPEPQVIAATQNALGVPTVILRGNHEMVSTAYGDHSLAPLAPVAEVIETPQVVHVGDFEVVCVPYQPGPAKDWLHGAMKEGLSTVQDGGVGISATRVLVLHLGISDASTPYHLDGAHDSVSIGQVVELARAEGISYVLAGNWHRRKRWRFPDVDVLQVGALCPTGFNNPGIDGYGTVAILDHSGLRIHAVPGPRFLKCSGIAGMHEAADAAKDHDGPIYLSASVRASDRQEADMVKAAMVTSGAIYDGRVVPDEADAVKTADEAAQAAQNAASFEDAVREYSAAQTWPENVDAGDVAEASIAFLYARDAEDVIRAMQGNDGG